MTLTERYRHTDRYGRTWTDTDRDADAGTDTERTVIERSELRGNCNILFFITRNNMFDSLVFSALTCSMAFVHSHYTGIEYLRISPIHEVPGKPLQLSTANQTFACDFRRGIKNMPPGDVLNALLHDCIGAKAP